MADQGPISEGDLVPNSLDELFSRNPLNLSDSDVDMIVEALRRQYVAHAEAKRHAVSAGKRTPRSAATKAVPSNISLEDLM